MYRKLFLDNKISEKRQKLLDSGKYKLNSAGKIVLNRKRSTKPAYIFVGQATYRNCHLYNEILTQCFGIIPEFCRYRCWKTVVSPGTCKETFQLYEILCLLQLPSKCGCDVRNYTFGPWRGYVYGDSLEHGLEQYNLVKTTLNDFNLDMPVVLKRGCTEMEMLKPSDTWSDDFQVEKERYISDSFAIEEKQMVQSEWIKQETKERWIRWAITIGDPTAREMAEANSLSENIWQKLVVQPVTYCNREE